LHTKNIIQQVTKFKKDLVDNLKHQTMRNKITDMEKQLHFTKIFTGALGLLWLSRSKKCIIIYASIKAT
jgi:hypothetical protein